MPFVKIVKDRIVKGSRSKKDKTYVEVSRTVTNTYSSYEKDRPGSAIIKKVDKEYVVSQLERDKKDIEEEKLNLQQVEVKDIILNILSYSTVRKKGWSLPNITNTVYETLQSENDTYEEAIKLLSK